jgi:4'-phosphopantetheinyl transferase
MTPGCTIPTGRVDLWTIDLEQDDPTVAMLAGHLDHEECARAARFPVAVHRTRFIVRRHAYRAILAQYLHCDPRTLIFATNQFGKPTLSRADVEYNASHSDAVAMLAVTGGSAVGLDIERVRDRGGHYEWLSDDERRRVLTLPPDQRTTEALRMWTRKEAYVKALGLGVTALDANLRVPPAGATESVRWTVIDLDPRPGYVGSLAVPFERPTIVARHWMPTSAFAVPASTR